jgi:hypothetical protein
MSETPGTDALQFERADFGSAPSGVQNVVCASCHRPVLQSYYTLGDNILCSACREERERAGDAWGGVRLLRAILAGFGAAVAGAVLWWGVRKLTGYEIGIISIAIGIGVGRAVLWGSRNRGGVAYQLLAVFLTYAAVAGNYMPDVVEAIRDQAKNEKPAATASAAAKAKPVEASAAASAGGLLVALAAIFALAAIAPFMAGASNIIGLLIIAFGLWEAWKINRRRVVEIRGPFAVTHG